MKASITNGVTEQEKIDITQSFEQSAVFRKHLIKMLQQRIETNQKDSCSSNLYESPNWALVQADYKGAERTYREIINLLS